MGVLERGEKEEDEYKVPLLESLYPDCPGCKCAYLTGKDAGPPFKLLSMVMLVDLCNGLPISSLYPFIYFMVDDFGIAAKKEDIGYYAGAVGSAFMVGRLVSSVPWGIFADKYGRKTVFYLGLITTIIFQMIFGTTKNFWVAISARFLLGSLNGMTGPLKAYASEVCNEQNQAWGLSTISTSWSLGLILGPAMGGYFARPAANFPSIVSQDGFLAQYPYILPSIIQSAFALVGFVVVWNLPETVHKHEKIDSSFDEYQRKPSESAEPKESLLSNWALMASVTVYSVWSCVEFSFTEIFSLWSVSPRASDGLGLPTSAAGIVLAVSGFSVFVFNMTIFPIIAHYLGPILVTRVPAMITVVLLALFPFVSRLDGTLEWIALNILALTRTVLSTAVLTGTFMLINNSVPTNQRGAANGISITFVALARTVGPAFAGAVFAWSQSRPHATFLPGVQLVFAALELCVVVAIITTFPPFLPKTTNRPYYITHPQEEPDPYKDVESH
ncbi:hypothetical protein R1flu_025431 [Riccia fluitans]|uniref:Major facilitator superfamily (MFS) profile domain-containing protein n=1 Tax=Riccia fluitans TaxID=41844 RepID=A0ABD1XY61_9MARC